MLPLLPQILNVGITGHRPNKLTEAACAVAATQFRWVAECLDTKVRQIRLALIQYPTQAPIPLVRLVSGLAEGADQLAARNIPPGWLLRAILPMPRARYELDFGADANSPSRKEFTRLLSLANDLIELDLPETELCGTIALKARYYEQLGRRLVENADLLVTIWDGGKSAGPGGTADVVALAIDRRLPVVWLDANADAPPCLLFSLEPSRARHVTATATGPGLAALVAEALRLKGGGDKVLDI